jgi:hypothetical protein
VDRPNSSSERALRAGETANIVAATSPAAVRGGMLTLRGTPPSKEAVGFLSFGRNCYIVPPFLFPYSPKCMKVWNSRKLRQPL